MRIGTMPLPPYIREKLSDPGEIPDCILKGEGLIGGAYSRASFH